MTNTGQVHGVLGIAEGIKNGYRVYGVYKTTIMEEER
jgi:hypothetical protein